MGRKIIQIATITAMLMLVTANAQAGKSRFAGRSGQAVQSWCPHVRQPTIEIDLSDRVFTCNINGKTVIQQMPCETVAQKSQADSQKPVLDNSAVASANQNRTWRRNPNASNQMLSSGY